MQYTMRQQRAMVILFATERLMLMSFLLFLHSQAEISADVSFLIIGALVH